jgi:glycosyltransferase involved in cell wall biosynthesis
MEIKTFIGRKLNHINGILRVQVELRKPLKKVENLKFSYEYYNAPQNTLDFIAKRYVQYPLSCYGISKRSGDDTIFNISYQNLADLVHFLDLNKTILTCADIYTFITRRNIDYPFFIQKYWLSGFKRCRYFITISEFSKEEMVSKLGISENRIKVIKCAINREIFKPINEDKISMIKPLYPDYKKVLYVGTEARRKNYPTLLKAFYLLKKEAPNILVLSKS